MWKWAGSGSGGINSNAHSGVEIPTAFVVSESDEPPTGLRITSYNVCYTKLLRDLYKALTDTEHYPDPEAVIEGPPANRTAARRATAARTTLPGAARTGPVITSYSIHYTKLYEQLNRTLADGYVPARHYPPVERRYLSSTYRGSGFVVDDPPASKTGDKTILVLTGNRLSEDSANASVVESSYNFV